MTNLYRGPNAPRPNAEQLAEWEEQADFIYRAQVLNRLSTRPLAKAIQNDVSHATRILALVAEVDRLRTELSVSQANVRDQQGTVEGLLEERDLALAVVKAHLAERDKLTSLRSAVAGVQSILGRALAGEVAHG